MQELLGEKKNLLLIEFLLKETHTFRVRPICPMSDTRVNRLTHQKCPFTSTESQRLLEGAVTSPTSAHTCIRGALCAASWCTLGMLIGVAGSSRVRQLKKLVWRVGWMEFCSLSVVQSLTHSGTCGRLLYSLCPSYYRKSTGIFSPWYASCSMRAKHTIMEPNLSTDLLVH